jgi:hypothetical protein
MVHVFARPPPPLGDERRDNFDILKLVIVFLVCIAAMLEERWQKKLIGSYWIWSVFSSNMTAVSLSYKSEGIDFKPPIWLLSCIILVVKDCSIIHPSGKCSVLAVKPRVVIETLGLKPFTLLLVTYETIVYQTIYLVISVNIKDVFIIL